MARDACPGPEYHCWFRNYVIHIFHTFPLYFLANQTTLAASVLTAGYSGSLTTCATFRNALRELRQMQLVQADTDHVTGLKLIHFCTESAVQRLDTPKKLQFCLPQDQRKMQ